MVKKIKEEGEKWVIKQGEGIFIYLFLSPLLVRSRPGNLCDVRSCSIAQASESVLRSH